MAADRIDVVEELQRPSPPFGSRAGLDVETNAVGQFGGQGQTRWDRPGLPLLDGSPVRGPSS